MMARYLTPDEARDAMLMLAAGETYQAVADHFGATRQAIHARARRLGLDNRAGKRLHRLRLIERIVHGEDAALVAASIDLTPKSLLKSARAMGFGVRATRRELVVELYAAGIPTAEIAARLGIAQASPSNVANRAGLRRLPAHHRRWARVPSEIAEAVHSRRAAGMSQRDAGAPFGLSQSSVSLLERTGRA